MHSLTFDQACLLIGRKDVQVLNEKHESIASWISFFGSVRYYTDKKNLDLLTRKNGQQNG